MNQDEQSKQKREFETDSELTYEEAKKPIHGVKDNVNPSHYTEMAISPHEYNKANGISWNEAQVIKYVSRWKAKNGKEDLLKALWYLNDLIDGLEDGSV